MKYGLIAEKLGHSFSKEIHTKLFGYSYELKELSPEQLDTFMREKDFTAINVTIPYKETVIPYLDHIDETAKEIGAVNTIVNRSGKLYGYNTDLEGIIALIRRIGIEIKDKKVLVLGSGGTSKTAYFAAKKLGCSFVSRVSRSGKDGCLTYDSAKNDHSDADVIINTTPAGMFPNLGNSSIDINDFPNVSGVVDAVYNPLRPKLVVDCNKKGIKAVGGLYMLVAQAAFAAEKFVGETVPAEKVDEVYREIYNSKQNIVLVGMPGCGKTTVGKILSRELDRELVDTDKLINEKTGKSPAEIISELGEKAFRDIETEVVKEVSALQGKVISTGGGAVLRSENIDNLRQNGWICFLDRSLDDIRPTGDRPLSSNRDDLQKRYDERYPIYCGCCDYHLVSKPTPDLNASAILEEFK